MMAEYKTIIYYMYYMYKKIKSTDTVCEAAVV